MKGAFLVMLLLVVIPQLAAPARLASTVMPGKEERLRAPPVCCDNCIVYRRDAYICEDIIFRSNGHDGDDDDGGEDPFNPFIHNPCPPPCHPDGPPF